MFHDTAPHHFAPAATRAECRDADEAAAQAVAARAGRDCYTLADSLAMILDRAPSDWSADDQRNLDHLRAALTYAATIAERLS